MNRHTSTTLLFTLLFSLSTLNAKEPLMLQKGKLLVEETYDSPDIPESWKTSGEIKVVDGTLQWFSEEKMDKASLSPEFIKAGKVTLADHILEYTFTYQDDLYRNLIVYNDQYGHAIIIVLSSEFHHIKKWPDQNILHRFEEFPDAAGSSLQPGQRYTVMIEMRGSEIMVHADDENFLLGKNHRVANPKSKLVVNFMHGKGTLDSIRIWEATPNPEWYKNRATWIAKKQERPQLDTATQSEFEFKFRVANLRRQLREKQDPEYATIVKETAAFLEEIRAQYPFFGGKPTRQNLAAKKKARQEDTNYQQMMKKLALLEKIELAYFQKLDPRLLELGSKGRKKK